MGSVTHTYSKGDWIVHTHYGVGQIKGVETKVINGEKVKYFRVKTKNSTFWVPYDQTDTNRLRPLASSKELTKAIKALNKPAIAMDPDHNKRKLLIKTVSSDPSLVSMAKLVRDLSARRQVSTLNTTEERALTRLTERLVREWAVCMEITVEEAQQKLHQMLVANQT